MPVDFQLISASVQTQTHILRNIYIRKDFLLLTKNSFFNTVNWYHYPAYTIMTPTGMK